MKLQTFYNTDESAGSSGSVASSADEVKIDKPEFVSPDFVKSLQAAIVEGFEGAKKQEQPKQEQPKQEQPKQEQPKQELEPSDKIQSAPAFQKLSARFEAASTQLEASNNIFLSTLPAEVQEQIQSAAGSDPVEIAKGIRLAFVMMQKFRSGQTNQTLSSQTPNVSRGKPSGNKQATSLSDSIALAKQRAKQTI